MASKSKSRADRRRNFAPRADRPLGRLRVVLVRPEFAGNVGAAARVMANFGLRELVLVAPVASIDDPQARAMATHGAAVLSAARIVPDLAGALADCTMVVGTTARSAGLYRGQAQGRPAEVFAALAAEAAVAPAAIIFGPEDRGLTNEETALCTRLVSLPTAPEFPVLNLAQAVAICLYELQRVGAEVAGGSPAATASTTAPGPATTGTQPPAVFAHRERMFAQLEDALTRVGFLFGDNPRHLMFALRNLILRAGVTGTEADILIGLARQIRWYVEHHPRVKGD